MAMISDKAIFIDTNILIYANVAESPFHESALRAIEFYYKEGYELWISRQVLREYLAILTRPNLFTNPKPVSILIDRIRYFESRFLIAEDSLLVTKKLLNLIKNISVGGSQIHDANIVATMLVQGIGVLLTLNVADFQRFSDHISIETLGN